jgi:hypothetical protein
MYQLNETEIWREHRRDLLREAENPRRPKAGRRTLTGAVKRRAALLLSTMGLAMLLVAGAAYALDIQCEFSEVTPCLGTEEPDFMTGTEGLDHIVGLDDDDEIHGLAASDRLTGDGNFTVPGDDELFGGPGFDTLFGGAGSDLLAGGKDGDQISADFLFNDGTDTVKGGSGNDMVRAAEGAKDIIDCGRGSRDRVEFDAGLDKVKNCEIKDAL